MSKCDCPTCTPAAAHPAPCVHEQWHKEALDALTAARKRITELEDARGVANKGQIADKMELRALLAEAVAVLAEIATVRANQNSEPDVIADALTFCVDLAEKTLAKVPR
jgi:hypothetical protein